ncbi:MAG TPA: hypothetical protein VKE93_15525 [Candidatus Angelobacter sp.]|nr:hypothetical protein [Candidatus Angelobacter sp.]
MSSIAVSSAPSTPNNAFLAIFWGGLAAGIFDITQAMVAWHFQAGVKPIRIWQSVASGLLGPDSFKGGLKTAVLGGVLHFFIAFSAATVYYIASRKLTFMTSHAVLSGLLYGEAVFMFMYFVVLPLSRAGKVHYTTATIVTGPIGHVFLVGLPIALAVRRWAPLK